MKKQWAYLLAGLFTLMSGTALVGCDGLFGVPAGPKDYNADIQVVAPENIDTEHFVAEEDKTYYTSPGFSLCVEVNGSFMIMDYFTLEGTKRIYDNVYLYEEDYFYIVTDDYKDLYASLGDPLDAQYAEEEKEQGYDVQINVKKAGIYKIIFDVEKLKFDMEYKAEIQTPVYYSMKNCSIYSVATSWVEMGVNPANSDEFVINNFNVEAGKIISFYNNLHVSNYKVTLEESIDGKLAEARKALVTVNVGGAYNIYVNKKTYVVRMELLNPETASYSCVYYDGTDFIELAPYDAEVPYVYRYRIAVDKYDFLPKFHTKNYKTYDLTVIESYFLKASGNDYFFQQAGMYDVIVNLKTFEISVELLPV